MQSLVHGRWRAASQVREFCQRSFRENVRHDQISIRPGQSIERPNDLATSYGH
jgi:hypothetical protein